MSDDLFSEMEEAEKERDASLARIGQANKIWLASMLANLKTLRGFTGTAEDVRLNLLNRYGWPPEHHNAWGAFTRSALKERMIQPTGEWRKMRTKKSHARRTPVYLVVA